MVAPAIWALVAGSGAAASYAWYDPDFFTSAIWSNAELDDRVLKLNNYWNLLESRIMGRIDPSSDAAKDVRRYVSGWLDFKRRYDEAIFRRAADPWGLWGAKGEFEEELGTWAKRFSDTLSKVIAIDPLIHAGLEARGVDIETYMQRSNLNSDGTSMGSNTALYVGVAVTVVLIGIGAVLAGRR